MALLSEVAQSIHQDDAFQYAMSSYSQQGHVEKLCMQPDENLHLLDVACNSSLTVSPSPSHRLCCCRPRWSVQTLLQRSAQPSPTT